MANGGKVEKKKIVQFVAIFHLLKHGRPMINFEHMKGLYDFLKIHHMPRKHLTYSTSWGMVVAMHDVILKQIMLFGPTS